MHDATLRSAMHVSELELGLLQIKPLEEAYKFGSFFSSLLSESDFEAKPSVLLLGQYSTGKTTFIKHLLGRDYPGIHIGPEPTTGDCCFTATMHGPSSCSCFRVKVAVMASATYRTLLTAAVHVVNNMLHRHGADSMARVGMPASW